MKDKKILVVDFDEESLISLSNLVFEEGFQAVTAQDGLSGYEKFKAEDFDLLMVEPMLPKMHGFELMKKVNQDPRRKIPIIVVTGIYREPSCKMEALQVYGASGYFTKPYNKDDLRAKMLQLLANGKEEPAEKRDTPAPPPAKRSAGSTGDEWGLLKKEAPPRNEKTGGSLDDLEKELQAAVAGLAGTERKKEPVKDAAKEKREVKADVDRDIEALLKGAIGGLGLEEKKRKKVETATPEVKRPVPPPVKKPVPPPAVRPVPPPIARVEPAAKPAPPVRPQPELDKGIKAEKIPLVNETRERIPPQPRIESRIPPAPVRPPSSPEKASPSIDQTLIEIDKIPLDIAKDSPEPERAVIEIKKPQPEKKRDYFNGYAEPAKKKPPVAMIGGLAAALLIIAGTTFIVFKPKKPQEPAPQMVSSLQPSLPSEFAEKQEETAPGPADRGNVVRSAARIESQPAPRKETVAPTRPPSAADNSVPIAPILPQETPPLGLELQSDPAMASSSSGSGESIPEEQVTPRQEDASPPEAPPAKPQANDPIRVMAKPGDLVPLESVDVAPVLLKKVDPKYPLRALELGVGGTVTVNALISEAGGVIRTEILKGITGGYGLERAAETAIRQWQFKAAEKDGVPVRVWKPLDIVFKTAPTENQ